MKTKSNLQPILGWILFVLLLVVSKSIDTGLRMILGLMLGYTLMRAYTGFAGSVNRAYRGGSTKLMRAMALMFFVTSLIVASMAMNVEPGYYDFWINPINLGLLVGGILFGFGMSLSSCCASGVMTDLVTGLPRAAMTLLFFALGVFVGFPLQHSQSWIQDTWFHSASYETGVYMPDWFAGGAFGGYLGAIILTGIFCLLICAFALMYEKKKRESGEYTGIDTEILQEEKEDFNWSTAKIFSRETYDHVFAKPWTLTQGAIALSIIFGIMLSLTKSCWGASTPYGFWFGKILMMFGVSADSIATFVKGSSDPYVLPFMQHGVSVQDMSIALGALVYLLMADVFSVQFKEGLKIQKRDLFIFALGGFTMGIGNRFANGCNVGALYSPIATFSLSGWIYIIFLFAGGFLGNSFAKKWNSKCNNK